MTKGFVMSLTLTPEIDDDISAAERREHSVVVVAENKKKFLDYGTHFTIHAYWGYGMHLVSTTTSGTASKTHSKSRTGVVWTNFSLFFLMRTSSVQLNTWI